MKEREEQRRRKLDDLRSAVQIGNDQADKGEVAPLTRELIDDVKRCGRERRAARRAEREARANPRDLIRSWFS